MESVETPLGEEINQEKDLSINEKLNRMFDEAGESLREKDEYTAIIDEEWISELTKQVLQSSINQEGVDLDSLSADVSFKDGKAEVSLDGDAQRIRTIKGKEIRGLKKKVKAQFRLLNSRDEFLGDVVAFGFHASPDYVDSFLQEEIRGNELSKKFRAYIKDRVRDAGSVKFKILEEGKMQVDFRKFPETRKKVELPGWLKSREELAKRPHIAEVDPADKSETLSEKKTRQFLEKLSEEDIRTPKDFVEMFHQDGKGLVEMSFAVLDKNKDSEENRETLTALTRKELDKLSAFNLYLRENPPAKKIQEMIQDQVVTTRHLIHLAGEISIVSSKKRAKDLNKELRRLEKRRQKAYSEISSYLGQTELEIEKEDSGNLSKAIESVASENKDKPAFSFDLKKEEVEDMMLRTVNLYKGELEAKGALVNPEEVKVEIKDGEARVSLKGNAKVKTGLVGRVEVPLRANLVIDNTPEGELAATNIQANPAELLDVYRAHLRGKGVDGSFKRIIATEMKKKGLQAENIHLRLVEDRLEVDIERKILEEEKVKKKETEQLRVEVEKEASDEKRISEETAEQSKVEEKIETPIDVVEKDLKPQDVRKGAALVRLFEVGADKDKRLVLFWWDSQKKTVFGEEVDVNGKSKEKFRYSVTANKEEDARSLIIKGSGFFTDEEEKLNEVPINSLKIEEISKE